MLINKDDKNSVYFQGITIFDDAGRPLNFVNEIDTETLLCKVGPLGRVVVAAGFVIIPQPRIYDYLPEGLFPFVIPIKNPSPDQIHDFVMKLLQQRGDFKRSVFSYDDMNQDKDVENTFDWPRESFVALAETVRPSEEEDLDAARRVEKSKWEGGCVVHEKTFTMRGGFQLPWEEAPTKFPPKCQFSSLWLKTKDGELAQWGVAVKPPIRFAVPNARLRVDVVPKKALKDVSDLHKEQLLQKTWKVISTRGMENGTIELMMVEHKE